MDSDAPFKRATWSWPSDLDLDKDEAPTASAEQPAAYGTHREQPSRMSDPAADSRSHSHEQGPRPAPRQKHYKPRTCRICLEVVQPVTEMQNSRTGLFAPQVRVRYVGEDPNLGRLISPCKCKGSQKYVHEGCLRLWRQAQPFEDRNYWSCPTCEFKYRLQRLRAGKMLLSWPAQAALTLTIMFLAVFLLGFIADPIINLWIDPVGSVADGIVNVITDVEGLASASDDEPFTWSGHLLKGFLSLGLVGFVKTFFALGPWYWFRWGLNVGGGRRNAGRDRVQNINWAYIVIGIVTFMGATWKLVNYFSMRVLQYANEKVLDIQQDGDDDDDDDDEPLPKTGNEANEDI